MCKNTKDIIFWLNNIEVPFTKNKENNIAQKKFA